MKKKKKQLSWLSVIAAVVFIAVSLIEITALPADKTSTFEKVFWWACLIFWIFTGTAIVIIKLKENKK